VDLAKELRGLVDEVKISAYDLTYQALIEEAAQLGVPLILSTAMSTEAEIRRALRWANTPATLLHGTACYPALLENSRLRRFLALQRQFPYQRWGLSDHTIDWRAAAGAVLLGAVHIEKHFALDGVPGITKSPDYPHSIPPRYFSILVQHCLSSLSMLGDGEKAGPLPCEEPLYKLRRTNERPLR
jgi:sialic acid synthase SpsE